MSLQEITLLPPGFPALRSSTTGNDGIPGGTLRTDSSSEYVVDIGLRLQEVLGTSDAAKFLEENNISINVTLRVLLHPAQRRCSVNVT